MEFGMSIFATDTTIEPVELARTAEALGFESLWLPEHSHIPTSRDTPWGGREGAPPLPEKYWRTYDVLVAFGAMATVTTNLKLASGINLLAQRDPIWTAKEVATIDHLSGGRFVFGVGFGWNIEEMNHHGVEYRERRALLREKVLMMKELWTKDEASFHGELLTLEPSWSWPKPVQDPHPPVVLGGKLGPKLLSNLVEFCDGWVPHRSSKLPDQILTVRHALEDAGRDPAAFQIWLWSQKPEEQAIEFAREVGVSRIVFDIESNAPEPTREQMEQAAAFAAAHR